MKERVVITGYKEVNFKNEKDNKEVDLVKISYFGQNSGDGIGFLPLQSSYSDDKKRKILHEIDCVPGLYEAEYGMIPGKNNKPTLQIIGFSFVSPVDLKSLFEE